MSSQESGSRASSVLHDRRGSDCRSVEVQMSGGQDSREKTLSAFQGFTTCNVSDALDALGIEGTIAGIGPLWPACPKIVGFAVTLKMSIAGREEVVIGSLEAVDAAMPGDLVVIDNRGRLDVNTWGGLVSLTAKKRGVVGTVIDGATRDVDEFQELGFPVYARGTVPTSVRGRIAIEDQGIPIQCGRVVVEPGDLVMADRNGVAIIPRRCIEDVLNIAGRMVEIEARITRDIETGVHPIEAHRRHRYTDAVRLHNVKLDDE